MPISVAAATASGIPVAMSAIARNCAAPEYMISDIATVSPAPSPDCEAATPNENAIGK